MSPSRKARQPVSSLLQSTAKACFAFGIWTLRACVYSTFLLHVDYNVLAENGTGAEPLGNGLIHLQKAHNTLVTEGRSLALRSCLHSGLSGMITLFLYLASCHIIPSHSYYSYAYMLSKTLPCYAGSIVHHLVSCTIHFSTLGYS